MTPRRKPHPFVRQLLSDHAKGRLAPLVGRCAQCGPGYLVGDAWYATGRHAYQDSLGTMVCPYCGTRQGIWAPFQACINGRCKRVVHWHLSSPAWQAAAVMRSLS